MVIQFIRFESALDEDGVLDVAEERLPQFRALSGLLQKYYVKLDAPNQYGGIYVWDSKESLAAYRASDLCASIPAAYKVKGKPTVETLETFIQLRK